MAISKKTLLFDANIESEEVSDQTRLSRSMSKIFHSTTYDMLDRADTAKFRMVVGNMAKREMKLWVSQRSEWMMRVESGKSQETGYGRAPSSPGSIARGVEHDCQEF
jgi:hypothetical protein